MLSETEQKTILRENKSGKRPMFRRRVDLFCKQCIYDDKASGEGTWRQQVESCGDLGCPLWPLRPVSETYLGDKPARKAPNKPQTGTQGPMEVSEDHEGPRGPDGLLITPNCTVCGMPKSPRGRDVGVYAANGYCDWECEGYDQDPKPSQYWSEDEPEF